MILYLAGPMSHLPDNNYPAFHTAAAALRAAGHTVLNPAESPPPEATASMTREQVWQYFMRLSVRQISEAEALAMLPNWPASKGAVIEYGLAQSLQIPVFYLQYCRGAWAWVDSSRRALP